MFETETVAFSFKNKLFHFQISTSPNFKLNNAMEKDKKNQQPENSGNEKPVRIIESAGEDMEEMYAGHKVPGADPPKNEHARGGFGDRDGKTGFGSDSGEGVSAVTVNDDSDESSNIIPDGIPTAYHSDAVDDPDVEMPSMERMQQDVSDLPDEMLRDDDEDNDEAPR